MFILLSILATPAHAWEIRLDESGQELLWNTENIPYSVNVDGNHGLSAAAFETLIAAATRNWTTPLNGQLTFSQEGRTTSKSPSHTNDTNAIYFDENWTQDPSLLALTYVWSNPQGEIIGFDLAVNATDHSWATDGRAESNDLLNTLSHEIGHALGIDHSPDVTLATMYPSSPAGEVHKRDLHDDDVAAAVYLYTPATDAQSSGCSTTASTRGSAAWLFLLPALLCLRSRENT
jgi:hypothetical protein